MNEPSPYEEDFHEEMTPCIETEDKIDNVNSNATEAAGYVSLIGNFLSFCM